MAKINDPGEVVEVWHPGSLKLKRRNKVKVVEFEKALTVFDDYPDGVDVYYFYIQKKMDNEWLWDEDKLLYEEALRKYPKNKFIWKEVDVDSL